MKTLFEILEDARDGNKPTYVECYYSMFMLDALLHLETQDLRKLIYEPNSLRAKLIKENEEAFKRKKEAFQQYPKEWMGEQLPGNKAYDTMRKAGKKLIEENNE